jgi:hypothetical protein
MNKWSAIVVVIGLLLGGFVFVSQFQPESLPAYTGFFEEVVLATFGVAIVAIAINFVRKGRTA